MSFTNNDERTKGMQEAEHDKRENAEEQKVVEIWDDYDVRHKLGGRFHNFKSNFDRMEC